jgi:hypothetical protein
LVAVLLGLLWALPAHADQHRSDAQRLDLARDVFERLNAEREARGLDPLGWDERLAALAADWSAHMAATGELAHRDMGRAYAADAELSRWFTGLRENVGYGAGGLARAGAAHRKLMESDGHRATLLSARYDAVGVGVVCDDSGKLWVTQNFASQWAHDFDGEEPWSGEHPPRKPLVAGEGGPGCADEEAEVSTAQPTLAREYAAPEGKTPSVDRLDGTDRVGTAAALAAAAWPADAHEVLLARADDYADALAGSGLAGVADAPILLTGRDRLPADTAAQMERLAPERVVALGGAAAVSDGVLQEAADAADAASARVAGANRFATAAAIADEVAARVGGVEQVLLAEGRRGWPDAVAASAVAAAEGTPLLLTSADSLADTAAAFLGRAGVRSATLLGGAAVIGEEVADDVAARGVSVARVAGAGRFDTASQLRRRAADAGRGDGMPWLVTLADWPDALTVGPAVARAGALPYHVDGRHPRADPSDAYAAIAEQVRHGRVERLRPVGGPAAIDRETVQEALVRTPRR